MSNKGKRAAIYCRVANRDEMALADQIETMQNFVADSEGWTLAGVYKDEVPSAAMSERSGLQNLLADAKAHTFDIVAVRSLSRIARSQDLLTSVYGTLKENGVEVITLTGETMLRFGFADCEK